MILLVGWKPVTKDMVCIHASVTFVRMAQTYNLGKHCSVEVVEDGWKLTKQHGQIVVHMYRLQQRHVRTVTQVRCHL
jgi:hypothetical protein